MSIQSISDEFKLSPNAKKSEVCHFTLSNPNRHWKPKIVLGKNILPVTNSPRYLGVTLDQTLSYQQHIANTVARAKRRLNIMKCISGKNWGADAKVLQLTYKTLIRPLLEYAAPVWCSASDSLLHDIDSIQHSAAKIICGLRDTCASAVAEFEADLLPLKSRRQLALENYIVKRLGADENHRTAAFIKQWSAKARIKRTSPMQIAEDEQMLDKQVERTFSTTWCAPNKVNKIIKVDLGLQTGVLKKNTSTAELKKLGENKLQSIQPHVAMIFTDGSSMPDGRSGSGVHAKLCNKIRNVTNQNPVGTSNFTAELRAMDIALDILREERTDGNAYIISDSKSAIQVTADCFKGTESYHHRLAKKISQLRPSLNLHLSWVPSHTGIAGNEIADQLAKSGASKPAATTAVSLTSADHISKKSIDVVRKWRKEMTHDWYDERKPGATIDLNLTRQEQTTLSRLKSGHLKTLRYNGQHVKTFPNCHWCNGGTASPQHIMQCIGLPPDALYNAPRTVLHRLRVRGFMDQV